MFLWRHKILKRIGGLVLATGLAAFQIFWCCCSMARAEAAESGVVASSRGLETESPDLGNSAEGGEHAACHGHAATSPSSHHPTEHGKSCDHACQVSAKTFAGEAPILSFGFFTLPVLMVVAPAPEVQRNPTPAVHATGSTHGPPLFLRHLRILV